MFCLLADVRIRQTTDNEVGLQHALRAVNNSRDFRRKWDFLQTLAVGDSASGGSILLSMYEEMKDKAISPDLQLLWKNLGIVESSGSIAFDDRAPPARIRNAITTA